jgi:hypothetical protein
MLHAFCYDAKRYRVRHGRRFSISITFIARSRPGMTLYLQLPPGPIGGLKETGGKRYLSQPS